MVQVTTCTLDVPGACLYYEIRGSGPVLLLMGAPLPSAFSARMADVLAAEYTVVTYDPRGISRSARDDPDQDVTPELLADDVHRLLAALGSEPAYLYGNSGGATTGLALVTRHPQQVHALVAHEPPLPELLPERAQLRAMIDDVYVAYRDDGPEAAWRKFLIGTGIGGGSVTGPQRDAGDAGPRIAGAGNQADDHCFFAHMLRPFTRYQPDIRALRAASAKIVVGAGIRSAGELPHRAAAALAARLDMPLADFPGGHASFGDQPGPFGQALRQVLAGTSAARR